MKDARSIAEETARASYGRLLAWLTARTRDVAMAEDALADAFRAALEHWPKTGAPASPEAWLLTTARRKLIDQARRAKTRDEGAPALAMAAEEAEAALQRDHDFPDERLKLLFVCAHPAIDGAIRTPLMLQTVLGLDAERIASAFLIAPATMAQRLVRAKRKIRDAGIPFETPGPEDFKARLGDVLNAIYAAYTAGWDAADGADTRCGGLTREAIFLARLAAQMAPASPEALGLVSLLLHAEARRPARIVEGKYVALTDQDADLWDRSMIAEAEQALAKAWGFHDAGRFQIEAAIQSAHAAAKLTDRDTSDDIIILYQRLNAIAPSIGALVGSAAAIAAAGRNRDALAALDEIDASKTLRYQAFWAVRAHILGQLNDPDNAREAYQRAIGLSQDNASREFLRRRLEGLKDG